MCDVSYNFIEKVVRTEETMQAIKDDMKGVLRDSLSFWKDFKNFNNINFPAIKKNLEVGCE